MGFLSSALDTGGEGGKSSDGGLIGKVKSFLQKRSASADSKGAGDLGTMEDGTASAKKGGRVKKTGFIKLHRGEKVVRKAQARKRV